MFVCAGIIKYKEQIDRISSFEVYERRACDLVVRGHIINDKLALLRTRLAYLGASHLSGDHSDLTTAGILSTPLQDKNQAEVVVVLQQRSGACAPWKCRLL